MSTLLWAVHTEYSMQILDSVVWLTALSIRIAVDGSSPAVNARLPPSFQRNEVVAHSLVGRTWPLLRIVVMVTTIGNGLMIPVIAGVQICAIDLGYHPAYFSDSFIVFQINGFIFSFFHSISNSWRDSFFCRTRMMTFGRTEMCTSISCFFISAHVSGSSDRFRTAFSAVFEHPILVMDCVRAFQLHAVNSSSSNTFDCSEWNAYLPC